MQSILLHINKTNALNKQNSLLDLLLYCIANKRESQKELYQKYYGFVLSIALRYCGGVEEAEEVANDSFYKFFNSLKNFDTNSTNIEASVVAWIKRITVNTAIDHQRKYNKLQLQVSLDSDAKDGFYGQEVAQVIDKMGFDEILKLVQQLSPTYKTVFNLYVIDGMKHEEIAQLLNISVGTSKSNLSKARANLQLLIKEFNPNLYEQRRTI